MYTSCKYLNRSNCTNAASDEGEWVSENEI